MLCPSLNFLIFFLSYLCSINCIWNIFQLLVPVMTYEAKINKIKRKKNLNCYREQIKHLIAHSMAIDVKDSWLTGNDFFGEALWSNCSKLNSPGVQSSKPNDHSSISRISEILGGEEKNPSRSFTFEKFQREPQQYS